MRPPLFWFNPPQRPGWQAHVLAPLAWLVARATARRVARPGLQAGVPVICVGNLNLGGTGKTPTVIALQQILAARGAAAHVVSRGYGGTEAGPVQVDPQRHTAREVGDEPLLIGAFGPAWVARDRAAGVVAARDAGAQVVLLDDGFQNPSVAKDLSLLVVDAGVGFGNGRVAPSGPLRETVQAGLKRADGLILIGPPQQRAEFVAAWSPDVPVYGASLAPLPTGMDWAGARVVAFAGIGRPEKFFATLRGLGAELVSTHALDDHQPLGDALLTRLGLEAKTLGAQLVTTEKDAARMPMAYRSQVVTLPVRLEFEDPAAPDAILSKLTF
jgi:tetraacyldisaccharide 4'-kinase